MATKQIRPYGTWISPVTSEAIVSETVDMADIRLDGYDVYWTETRPKEGGRITVMWRSFNGQLAEMVPEPYNVRSRVHEYGGGAYTVYNGTVIFANFSDQRLYKIEPGADPEPITPEGDVRYADFTIDRSRSRLICVAEDHSGSGSEPTNSLVAIPLSGDGAITRLASGGDFYANPRVNPEDSLITWLAWDHPNMPWDETGLWVAELKGDGSIGLPVMVTGGDGESIFQPHWSPTGILHFVSDRTGWWNLYACLPEGITQLFEIKGDIACAQWKLGASTYGFESSENIVLTYTQRGLWYLSLADAKSGDLRSLVTRYTNISSIQAAPGMAVFIGSSPARAPALVQLDLTVIQEQELRQSSSVEIDSTCISAPEHIQFPSSGGRTAYAFYYPPANGDFEPPPGELPPLIVHCHGGPTGAASSSLDLEKQFWTSRGLAILDVNYGGSTGFGRDYRYLLHGKWGIVDVEDCIAGAHYLVQRGLVDEKRMAISGGSAGGYTVLCALTFHNTFAAGASYYGVSDLEALARETHKFESRYLYTLVGAYPAEAETYRMRSPINFVEKLSCPVIFLQGLEDKVVPPAQAERMVAALREKGIPVAYLPFAGEEHGFRRSENIKRALDAELYFYSRIFGFTPADKLEPVAIENL